MSVTISELSDGGLRPIPELSWHTFSDGCPHINVEPGFSLRGRDVVVTIRGGDPGQLFAGELAMNVAWDLSARRVVRFLPYLPGARQDKGTPNTARQAGNLITGAELTVYADAHSEVMAGFFNGPSVELRAVDLIPEELIDDDVGIIAPDAGAVIRARAVAERFDLPLFQGSKVRDPENNFRIKSFECEPVTTPRAIVVDDICDGGGTFLALAEATGLPRERLTLWTTHGIYSKGIPIIRERFGHIACTDSFQGRSHRADTVVPLEPHLINALRSDEA